MELLSLITKEYVRKIPLDHLVDSCAALVPSNAYFRRLNDLTAIKKLVALSFAQVYATRLKGLWIRVFHDRLQRQAHQYSVATQLSVGNWSSKD
jgi:hypothetical protein